METWHFLTVDGTPFCAQCGLALAGVAAAPAPAGESPSANSGTPDSLAGLVAPPTPQALQVTSKYLLINGYQISRNSPSIPARAVIEARICSVSPGKTTDA